MSAPKWVNASTFIICIAGGFWIGRGAISSHQSKAQVHNENAASLENGEKVVETIRPGKASAVAGNLNKAKGPLAEEIQWRERLEKLPLSQFPKLFEEELEQVGETSRIHQLLEVWRERDLEDYIVWMKTQPDSRTLGQANFGIGGIHESALNTIAVTDPERAWKLANQVLSPANGERWSVLRALIFQDGATALAFFKKHRDVFLNTSNAHSGFYGFDPMKAVLILREFPVGPEKAQIVGTMSRYYEDFSKDPSQAERWFDAISTEDKQCWSDAAKRGYPEIPEVFAAKMAAFRKAAGAEGKQ